MRHIRTRDIKARAEELLEGYDDAMDEKFNEEFRDAFSEHFKENQIEGIITYDDVQGFIDSFEQPDEYKWAYDKVNSEIDDMADQAHEEARDERWNDE